MGYLNVLFVPNCLPAYVFFCGALSLMPFMDGSNLNCFTWSGRVESPAAEKILSEKPAVFNPSPMSPNMERIFFEWTVTHPLVRCGLNATVVLAA